jgi:signal transduction histidine kinase/DNA-binding response OmpR family regulator
MAAATPDRRGALTVPIAALDVDFERLLALAPHPYMLLDPGFNIVWVNEAYLEATARAREHLIGRNLFEAFPGGAHDPDGIGIRQLRQSLDTVLQTRQPDVLALIRYAIPRETAGGTVFEDRYWSASHTPILDKDGQVALILQQTDDVTELQMLRNNQAGQEITVQALGRDRLEGDIFRRAREVQQEKEVLGAERALLRRLLEQASVFAAFLRGAEHVFEIANRSYLQLVGNRDVLGRPIREALPEIHGQGFFELLDQVYGSGITYHGQAVNVTLLGADGATLHNRVLDFIYQPITEPDGTVSGIFVLGSDVTEGKRAADELERYKTHLEDMVAERTRALEESEAERRRAEAALQQSQKMEAIGQLTGGVAHDFNNLLQILSGNLQLLQRRLSDPQDLKRLSASLGAVDRGAKLASQLLAFARRQPLEPRAIHLGRMVREMDELLRRALGEAIEVETVIAGGLWNTLTDPDQVQNAILNLAVNARDAMGGSGRLTIETGNAMLDELYARQHEDVQPGQYVMLAVSDTGSGMTPEVMAKAFEPFFTTKRDGRGTGLGLSMVYGFVKQSHGHIKIYSEPGSGTTVRIYLPRTHEAEEAVPDLSIAPIESGTETILVVEDDPVVQATVVDLLKDLGYTVLRANDGQSALTLARAGIAIDLLFTDVVMPGPVRAPDLARQVQALMPGVGVLFTSGYTENAIVHGGRLDPGVSLLSKPYRREDLARKVRHTLNNRGQAQAAAARATAAPVPMPQQQQQQQAAVRVLLVEDDPLIQMDSEDMLTSLGCRVTAVRDGRGALRELARGAFDVLFTDIGLPGISGVELARQALAQQPGIRVIFASGFGAREDARAAAPDALFVTKPYGLRDLEAALGRARAPRA